MEELVANFTLEDTPINAQFEVEEADHVDAIFEINATGAFWGNILGNIENQTDLKDILDGLELTINNNYDTLDGRIDSVVESFDDDIDTLSGQIDSNHQEITNIATTMQGYGDIVTYNAAYFATSAQGALADTALQPNDNISELTNNAGYITGIDSTDVVNALGYTPYDASNPDGYTTNVGTVTSVNNTSPDSNGNVTITIPDTAAWGNITGTLNNQTDLQNALDAKVTNNATGSQSIALGSMATATGTGSVSFGYSADATSTYAMAIGWDASASNTNTIAIGKGAKATAAGAIAIGTGSENSASYTFQVSSYKLLDLSDGLIPDARISTNIARSSDIPTFDTDQMAAINSGATATNIGQIATNTQDISDEIINRQNADNGLQSQIDALVVASDVFDIVGTYAELQAYDISSVPVNDIIKVLVDSTHDNAATYYRCVESGGIKSWSYIGAEGAYYTKSEADGRFVAQTTTINGHALSSNISLDASDVGALPDSTVIPTVNNSTITIQKNSSTVDTFTLNQSTAKTINISIPTDTSDLTNGAGYITGITSSDVTTALGYTPYDSSNPDGYTTNVGTVTKVNNTSPDANGNVSITIPSMNSSNNYVPYRSSASAFGNSTLLYNSNAMAFTGRLHVGSASPASYYDKGRLTIYDNTASQQTTSLALLNYGGGGGCGVAVDMYNTSANNGIPSGRFGVVDNGNYSGNLQLQVKKSGAAGNPLLPAMNIVPVPAANSLTTCVSFGQDEFNRVLFDLHKPEATVTITDTDKRWGGSGTTYSVTGSNKFNTRLLVAVGDIVSFDSFTTEATVTGVVSNSTTCQITTDVTLGTISNKNISVKKAYFKITDENNNTKIYVNPYGKFAIGTLSPSYDLDVVGTINASTDVKVNGTSVIQVQSDWNETDTSSKAYILNKPNIPAGVVVDQTYDGTSTNAQSGVAIAGAGFALSSNLATVATSGDYDDLTNKPTIPTVNDSTITIQQGGTTVDTFTTNQSTNKTINIPNEIFIAEYGTTTFAEVLAAVQSNKKVLLEETETINAVDSLKHYAELSLQAIITTPSEFRFSSVYGTFARTYVLTFNNAWSVSSHTNEQIGNKVTSISSTSTDTQYPSAKCVYNNLLTKADTTLSNVSSIDSNSAVQTALDSKADTDFSNISTTAKIKTAHLASPSNTSKTVTLGASGTEYTAPTDGYYSLTLSFSNSSAATRYCRLRNESNGIDSFSIQPAATGQVGCWTVAQKGQKVKAYYSVGTITATDFRFIPCVGSESEVAS